MDANDTSFKTWEKLTDAQRTVIPKFWRCVTNYTLSLFYIDAKNDTSFKTWEELTDAQRTVIASVVYQYGSENSLNSYSMGMKLNVGGDVTNYMLSLFYIDAKNDTLRRGKNLQTPRGQLWLQLFTNMAVSALTISPIRGA